MTVRLSRRGEIFSTLRDVQSATSPANPEVFFRQRMASSLHSAEVIVEEQSRRKRNGALPISRSPRRSSCQRPTSPWNGPAELDSGLSDAEFAAEIGSRKLRSVIQR
jgi:hypothetical protein